MNGSFGSWFQSVADQLYCSGPKVKQNIVVEGNYCAHGDQKAERRGRRVDKPFQDMRLTGLQLPPSESIQSRID